MVLVTSLSTVEARREIQTALGASSADMLSLYQRLLPGDFFDQLRQAKELCENNRVYNAAVVMWLMIGQRLEGNGTLETGVLELVRGLPASFWPRPCKRLQAGSEGEKLSSNTGSYSDARQGLPVRVVEQCFDRTFQQLMTEMQGSALGRQAFFLDGTSVRMPHTEELMEAYPPGSNQHGESHWPLLRMLVAHDVHSGLAMRPQWGPMNGKQAVSEQGLLEQALDRLPCGSVLLGDANFGVFSVGYAADQRGHPVVLRLSKVRAEHLLGGDALQDGIDRRIQWRPTREDRRSHSELPENACLEGRVIVRQVQPSDGSEPILLALFTTLETPADEIVEFYGTRWNIETDLRSLKGTLALEQLTCTSPEMVAKEIDIAILAYNLVRAVTCLAAQAAGLTPRSFSFTRVRNVIHAFAPLIVDAKDEQEARRLCDLMMYYVGQAKLSKRKRKRPSYRRAVWPKPHKFPKRKQ
jgi:hypothetical protein